VFITMKQKTQFGEEYPAMISEPFERSMLTLNASSYRNTMRLTLAATDIGDQTSTKTSVGLFSTRTS
jgi:hypothetical protein